jgi:putative thymidine phosphorylase
MAFYLSARKLDVRTGQAMIALINEIDAAENGVSIGENVALEIAGREKDIIVTLDTTDSLVDEGEVGFFEDVWEKFSVKFGEIVKVKLISQSEAVKSIRKKLLGGQLGYQEIFSIIKDIASDHLGTILTTYYAAAGYSPGFKEEEMYYMTKAMAETGVILHFEGIVADKHSIGGVAGKGVTPIVVPVVSCIEGITIPNTSTRAITSASATTDMLEVLMPMSFSREELEAMIMKNRVFMVWGGGLDLAPADDKIIQVQKPIGIESIDKFVASIVAKKVAQGVNHVVFDVPVGKGAKVETEEEFQKVKATFERVCARFGIKVAIHRRNVSGIDGNAVGPALECREFLRIYERDERRSLQLEEDALKMAGDLIELCGKAVQGEGYNMAKEILESGRAFEKLRLIIEQQGGNREISSNSLEIGGITWECKSEKEGVVKHIHNKRVFEVCRALGNPRIKEAGMYFYKKPGDSVSVGDKLATLYATTDSRMKLAQKVLESVDLFVIA